MAQDTDVLISKYLDKLEAMIDPEFVRKVWDMKLCGLKAGVSLYRGVYIIHAGFILTLKGEVFSGI